MDKSRSQFGLIDDSDFWIIRKKCLIFLLVILNRAVIWQRGSMSLINSWVKGMTGIKEEETRERKVKGEENKKK